MSRRISDSECMLPFPADPGNDFAPRPTRQLHTPRPQVQTDILANHDSQNGSHHCMKLLQNAYPRHRRALPPAAWGLGVPPAAKGPEALWNPHWGEPAQPRPIPRPGPGNARRFLAKTPKYLRAVGPPSGASGVLHHNLLLRFALSSPRLPCQALPASSPVIPSDLPKAKGSWRRLCVARNPSRNGGVWGASGPTAAGGKRPGCSPLAYDDSTSRISMRAACRAG